MNKKIPDNKRIPDNKTWADYEADKAAAIARASGGKGAGEDAIGLSLMQQEDGFEDTPEDERRSMAEVRSQPTKMVSGPPSWMKKPPKGFKVVKSNARDAQMAINKAKVGQPRNQAGQPSGSYFEKTAGGYTGYALVPIKQQ